MKAFRRQELANTTNWGFLILFWAFLGLIFQHIIVCTGADYEITALMILISEDTPKKVFLVSGFVCFTSHFPLPPQVLTTPDTGTWS